MTDVAAALSRRRVRRAPARRGRAPLPRPPSVPPAHARGRAHARAAPGAGCSTATTTRRASPSRTRSSSPSPRTRRFAARGFAASTITTARRTGEGGLALWLRLGRGRRARREEVASCAACCPACASPATRTSTLVREQPAGRGGGLVADRVLRARPHVAAHRRLGAALPVGRRRGARRTSARACRARGATARRRSSSWSRTPTTRALQERCVAALIRKTRDPLAPARLRHAATVTRARGARDVIGPAARPRLAPQGAAARRRAIRQARAALPRARPRAQPSGRAHRRSCATARDASAAIVAALGRARRAAPRATQIEADVMAFLRALRDARPAVASGVKDERRRRCAGPERRRALHADRRADLPLPAALPYCSNPIDSAARPDRARHRRVVRVFAEAEALGVDAAQPHRRRAAGARAISRRSSRARARSISTRT